MLENERRENSFFFQVIIYLSQEVGFENEKRAGEVKLDQDWSIPSRYRNSLFFNQKCWKCFELLM